MEKQPVFILGPCVIESEVHASRMARAIRDECGMRDLEFVFKASYDKANRSSAKSFRGPGLDEGLRILDWIRKELGVRVTSDVHDAWQAGQAGRTLDVVQVPAFLCRQTDIIVAASLGGKVVNIKKGQFLNPRDMALAVEKARLSGASRVWATERGSSWGYNDLVVDMRGLRIMAGFADEVIFDASHSVQKPGGLGSRSAGEPEFILPLAKAAVAAGATGIFCEVHDNPEAALSDGPNSLRLRDLGRFLDDVLKVWKASRP